MEVKFIENKEQFTLIPVIHADGKFWTPVAILASTCQKFGALGDGSKQTPQSFLPSNCTVSNLNSVGMDPAILSKWPQTFCRGNEKLRDKFKSIVPSLDGFTGHNTARALLLFTEKGIIEVEPLLTSGI